MNAQIIRRNQMNEIIKKIEDAQLKESVCDFRVGDRVNLYGITDTEIRM